MIGSLLDYAERDPMMVQHKIRALIQALLLHFRKTAAALASTATWQIYQTVEPGGVVTMHCDLGAIPHDGGLL